MMTAEARTPPSQNMLARRGLQLRHLRLLSALMETGQVSAAAARLQTTQPAASRLLAELESIVDAPLYERHSRGVALTDYGAALAQRAQRILGDLDAAARELAEMRAGARGAANLGAVTGPALELVLPVIRQIRLTHPQIEVSIAVETSAKLVDDLQNGRLDFFIGRLPADLSANAFDASPIGEEPLSLMVRDGHPLVGRTEVTIADCAEFDWVMQPQGALLTQTIAQFFERSGAQPPKRVVRTTSLLMTLALVSQSNAIAPVARSVVEFYSSDAGMGGKVATAPLNEELKVSAYSLIKLRDRALPPSAMVFFEALSQKIERAYGAQPS